ncbi:MAG: NAD(P)H-dependent oxidoreductase subunit E [Nitrospirota bacterium]|nr:NAD(P)H-dependent oxidoreductase subunit E [Nitrospirota bacterium]
MKVEELNVDEIIGRVGKILSEEDRKRGVLIYTFQKIQEEFGYLPEDVLKTLSQKLSMPLAEIYSVASFYKQFHFSPRGRKVVRVCTGTACHVRGAKDVLNSLESEFGIKEGETTEDLELTLETVGCVGCCGLAPVATVNEEVIGDIGTKKLKSLIKLIKEEQNEQQT